MEEPKMGLKKPTSFVKSDPAIRTERKPRTEEIKNYRDSAAAVRNPGGSKGEVKGGEEPHPVTTIHLEGEKFVCEGGDDGYGG
ncbi:hypothetical protein A2U01_0081522, partial [Trifolium medium]|nr:hypothetical protein [Trifolium medium]